MNEIVEMEPKKVKRFTTKYELADGTTVDMGLTCKDLIAVKYKNADLYTDVCKIIFEGIKDNDIEKYAKVLYAAYLASCTDDMSFDDFLEIMNPNVIYNLSASASMVNPSKK